MNGSVIKLDLNELTLRGGESYEHTFPLEMAPIVVGGESYHVLVPNGVTVSVDRVAGGFLVGISLVACLYGACERCLREAALEVEAKQQEFVPTRRDGWDESDLSPFIDDMVVDVGALAREATMLSLPNRIVCSPECRGLCQTCGHDLNMGPCDCPGEPLDERWSALEDVRFEE
ncbi:MAG: DUF177 domain-containing protein [Actinobacteria bacterium]|nr:DUF177 domain-containing protein [Actinomycetota bacterium]